MRRDAAVTGRPPSRLRAQLRSTEGFTLIELIGVMIILIIILTAVTTLFVSGSRAQVDLNERFQAQTEARVAVDRIRHEVHCASDLTLTSAASITVSLPGTCPGAGGSDISVVYSTTSVGVSHYQLLRNGSRIADHLTSGDVFSYVAPSADTLGKLHLDLPVNVKPSEPWKEWRLQTDVVLRNTTRS
jgi:type II secretory pathway pseudopilin PulG